MIPNHNEEYPKRASQIFMQTALEAFHNDNNSWTVIWFYLGVSAIFALHAISKVLFDTLHSDDDDF